MTKKEKDYGAAKLLLKVLFFLFEKDILDLYYILNCKPEQKKGRLESRNAAEWPFIIPIGNGS